MLDTILIQNFKGFKDTRIGPLRMVNLIIGGQNIGKTSVLEAIALAEIGENTPFRPNEGADGIRFATTALSHESLAIEVRDDQGRIARVQKVSQQLPSGFRGSRSGGHGNCIWASTPNRAQLAISFLPLFLPNQTELVRLFSEVSMLRKKRELTEMLQKVEPRLISLDVALPDGEHRIYAELDGVEKTLPIPQLGHGFGRLLYLYASLITTQAKLALIDEVENGIHYSALPILFRGIKAVAQDRQVQSLITTHSWDCLRAACEVFEDVPELFQVIRLERRGDDIQAVCIDGPRMQRLMAQDREVR